MPRARAAAALASIIFCTRASLGGSVMPPSDENTSWLVSTAMMSL